LHLILFGFVEDVGESALSAVLAVEVSSHEDAGTALLSGTLSAKPVDLAVVVHLVVLEHSKLDLLVLVRDLLGSGVILLLALLSTSPQSEDKMKGRFFLNVVVRESSSILELLSSKDETLLIWGNAFLVLDLGLDVLDRVGGLDIKGDGLAGQSLDEDLHTTAETEDEVEGGLLLDVVVRKSAAVLELLASEDEALLIWGNTFLVLNLGLDVLNGV